MSDIGTAETCSFKVLNGPQVWYGRDMTKRTDWIRPLTAAEIAELESAVAELDRTGIDIAAIGPRHLKVPGLLPLIEDIRKSVLHGAGFLLVRGVPVQRWSV